MGLRSLVMEPSGINLLNLMSKIVHEFVAMTMLISGVQVPINFNLLSFLKLSLNFLLMFLLRNFHRHQLFNLLRNALVSRSS